MRKKMRSSAGFITTGILLVFLALSAAGCAADTEEAPPLVDMEGLGGSGPEQPPHSQEPTTCADGAQKSCRIVIHQANGQKSCFIGAQFCVDGLWSACLEQ